MAISILEARGGSLIPQPSTRGYHIVYRDCETNYCPGCGRTTSTTCMPFTATRKSGVIFPTAR